MVISCVSLAIPRGLSKLCAKETRGSKDSLSYTLLPHVLPQRKCLETDNDIAGRCHLGMMCDEENESITSLHLQIGEELSLGVLV